jgi:hypothetical protein
MDNSEFYSDSEEDPLPEKDSPDNGDRVSSGDEDVSDRKVPRRKPFMPIYSAVLHKKLREVEGLAWYLALIIWQQYNMGLQYGRKQVKLSRTLMDEWNVKPHLRRSAVDALEEAGLIKVKRSNHSSMVVTIVDPRLWEGN